MRSTSGSLARVGALVLGVLVATAGCGVPLEGTATEIPADEVPFGLGENAAVTPTVVERSTLAQVYMVRDDVLWPVRREIVSPPSVSGVLGELAEGPTAGEGALGLRSLVNSTNLIGGVREGGGLVQVDLSPDVRDLPAPDQLIAVAQIVLTVTDVEPDSRVAFTIESTPIDAPLPGGETSSAPVGREDFASMVATP